MQIHEWLPTQLGQDIWNKKYRFENETLDQWFERVSGGNEDVKKLIQEKKFLFGGRILANRGLDKLGRKITLSNCYVISQPEDNIESIFECASKLARTFSYGGGCGIDISKLSPKGSKVNNAAKETTGAVSFMDIYSMVTEKIGQNGRRGALMISLDCDHPDLEEFIHIKSDLSRVTKANISIKITDKFMEAVKSNKDWQLTFKRNETGESITKKVKAKDLLKQFAKMNWDYAEPGALMWSRITDWNLLSEDDNFEYAGVNPCAEEPLNAGGSCLLGSINLAEFVVKPFTNFATFDMHEFTKTVTHGVIALNEVLHEGLNLHPLDEQRQSVNDWRQIGLGVFGWHDLLIKLGIKYGGQESLELAEQIGILMINQAVETSANVTDVYGQYPMYRQDVIVKSAFFNENITIETRRVVEAKGLANSQLLTVPPTGSIATMLGVSTALEPIYNISYTRKTESLHGKDEYYKVYTPIVEQYMKLNNITEEEKLPDFINCAMTLDFKKRIEMQGAWQEYIDASISSTVNVPNDFTVEDVENLYMYAWEKGLKGVTIYRDGCKREGILTNADTKQKEKVIEEPQFDSIMPVGRSSIGKTYGVTIDKKSACGKMFVTINRDKNGNIVESFVNVGKTGMCKSNIDGINRLVSLALRAGVKVDEIADQLKGITCQACTRVKAKGDKIDGLSCSDIIGRLLEEEYKDHVIIKEVKPKVKKQKEVGQDDGGVKCPECGTKLQQSGGCNICTNCSWSKCE